ncbi:hypothetical protein M409DRAFT_27917 [Zasmidium cellare ATCC 36951]|uniref:Uncharacterized protein n=1 Tax=Zasmidium cellare ATCC 36951 TaxID=1080233 RepID=A0A6A6C5I4_ZASCE|nr:uncharacterized protein M409DRAFT_27917 [Zasmidium cellare ATCC 36951]KAF2161518.1 hypothetical protein M409DRAFT_27917 [Zasmidium cellare ATCC 36951]
MTSKMQQYKRDKLYLPTANSNPERRPDAGDYQNYKKESAFRRLVSGALRSPAERQRRQPSSSEYESKRQTVAGPPEPKSPPIPDEDRDRRRRSHRKSTYSEAPARQAPRDDYDYRRPDERRYSKQSIMRPELKPLSSNPISSVDVREYRPVEPKAHNRATIDARRPYTTERLSRTSRRGERY